MKTKAGRLPDPGTTHRIGSARWRVAPGEEAFLQAARALRYDDRASVPGLELLKDARNVFWGRLRRDDGDWFVKGKRVRGWRRRLATLGRPSELRVEWKKTWWLRARGVATADPVAVGERRWLGALVEEHLAFRWAPGALNLLEFLLAKEASLPAGGFRRIRRRAGGLLGSLLGRLHAVGAYHRQFHDRNILVLEGGADGFRMVPIDLDHLTTSDRLDEADRDWNFHQLAWHLRRTIERWRPQCADVGRFLRGYHREDPSAARSWKDLYRRFQRAVPREPPSERPKRIRRP